MVDPLRFVSVHRRIDHPFSVADREEIHPRIVEFAGDARPQNSLSGIFNDAVAFSERFRSEHAAAVDGRFPDGYTGTARALNSRTLRSRLFCHVLIRRHRELCVGGDRVSSRKARRQRARLERIGNCGLAFSVLKSP